MIFRILFCIFTASIIFGCSPAEPTSVTDGLEQSQIDDYNAMIEEEERLAAEAGNIGAGE